MNKDMWKGLGIGGLIGFMFGRSGSGGNGGGDWDGEDDFSWGKAILYPIVFIAIMVGTFYYVVGWGDSPKSETETVIEQPMEPEEPPLRRTIEDMSREWEEEQKKRETEYAQKAEKRNLEEREERKKRAGNVVLEGRVVRVKLLDFMGSHKRYDIDYESKYTAGYIKTEHMLALNDETVKAMNASKGNRKLGSLHIGADGDYHWKENENKE